MNPLMKGARAQVVKQVLRGFMIRARWLPLQIHALRCLHEHSRNWWYRVHSHTCVELIWQVTN